MANRKITDFANLAGAQTPTMIMPVVDPSLGSVAAANLKSTLNDLFADLGINTSDGASGLTGLLAAPAVSAATKVKFYYHRGISQFLFSRSGGAYYAFAPMSSAAPMTAGNLPYVATGGVLAATSSPGATINSAGEIGAPDITLTQATAATQQDLVIIKNAATTFVWSLEIQTNDNLSIYDAVNNKIVTTWAAGSVPYLQMLSNAGINFAGIGTVGATSMGLAKNSTTTIEVNSGQTIAAGGAARDLLLRNLKAGIASSLTGTIVFNNSGSAFSTTFQAGVNITASRTYTWPTDFGVAGSVLTDAAGDGTLSWATPSGGSPGGSNTQIQYNNSSAFGGISTFTTDGTLLAIAATVTTGTGATSGLNAVANSLTTGDAFTFSSSSVTSGNVVKITATGTAAASNTKTALNVSTSGANATNSMTTYGGQFSNTSTGGGTTVNYGLLATASGGTTNVPLAAVFSGTSNVYPCISWGSSLSNVTSNLSGLGVGSNNDFCMYFQGSIKANITASFLILSGTNLVWCSGYGATNDLFLMRAAAASFRFGFTDAAAPVAQTFQVQNVVAGTTDTAGASWTFKASQGTGTGAGGDIVFKVAPASTTGSTQNALVETFRVGSTTQNALITVTTASLIGLTVLGAGSQTGDLQQWQKSGGAVQARIYKDGWITAGNGVTAAGVITAGAASTGGAYFAAYTSSQVANDAAFLGTFGGSAITGLLYGVTIAGSATTGIFNTLLNSENATSTAHCSSRYTVGGASAGDPFIRFSVSGVTDWSFGIRNSDSDKFYLNASTDLSTANIFAVTVGGVWTWADAINQAFSTGTGSQIGTAASQKIGHWGVTPVVQPSTTGTTAGFTAGAGTNVTDQSTFTGNTGSKAYTIGDIVLALKQAGFMAAS